MRTQKYPVFPRISHSSKSVPFWGKYPRLALQRSPVVGCETGERRMRTRRGRTGERT